MTSVSFRGDANDRIIRFHGFYFAHWATTLFISL